MTDYRTFYSSGGSFDCCGSLSLAGFVGNTPIRVSEQTRTRFDEDIKKMLRDEGSRYGIITAILNQNQRRNLGEILIANGFRPVEETGNPVHPRASVLTLYSFIAMEPPQEVLNRLRENEDV